MKVKDVTKYLESIAPLQLQENYDNSGLIIGSKEDEVNGVLVCSADLANSTNIAWFSKKWKDKINFGIYHKKTNPKGVLFQNGITLKKFLIGQILLKFWRII